MKKIKIAHILHSVGGVDVYLRLIVENIDSNKYDNVIIHGDNDTSKPFRNNKNESIPEHKITIVRNISLLSDFKAIYNGYKILKKEQPDLIHCHSAKGGIIGRLLGRLLNIKTFYTPNAFSYLSTDSEWKRKIYLAIEKVFANHNSILLSSSQSEENRGIEEVGYKKENTILFSNSINPILEIKPLSIEKTWPDEYICTVGRPSFQKNIELMIEALYEVNKIRKTHLVIMGVGLQSDKLESVTALINQLKINDRVTMLNWMDRENIFNIVKKSKFYISTARYEGLPYAIIESLALGKPCIVSDCDGNRDLVKDGYNGFVIDDNNPQTFKNKILQLIDDETLLSEFSKNAHDRFLKNCDITKNIRNLEKIYDEAVNQQH